MSKTFDEILQEELARENLSLDKRQRDLVKEYRDFLLIWNKKINLTRITEDYEFIVKNVVDSLMIEKKIKIPIEAKVADIGSGPGIPGIFLKIKRQDFFIDLIESQRKKVGFLYSVIEKLGLTQTRAIWNRAEELGKDRNFREKYDLVTARAVSSLDILLEYCLPLVSLKGYFVAMKSRDIKDELKSAKKAIDVLGGKLENIFDYDIGNEIGRTLVVIRKIKKTPTKFPRATSAIKKRPL